MPRSKNLKVISRKSFILIFVSGWELVKKLKNAGKEIKSRRLPISKSRLDQEKSSKNLTIKKKSAPSWSKSSHEKSLKGTPIKNHQNLDFRSPHPIIYTQDQYFDSPTIFKKSLKPLIEIIHHRNRLSQPQVIDADSPILPHPLLITTSMTL